MAYILEKIGNTYNLPKKYFTCDAKSDLDGISLVDVPIGSEAYCILEEESYILDSNKQWHKKKIGEDLTGQVQADWNQNGNTAADYIKNRPFYTGDPVETVVVEESTTVFSDEGGVYGGEVISTFSATVGNTYMVYWDGTVYESVCADYRAGLTAIGNLSIAGAGADTGEPFIIVPNGSSIYIYTADTSASHTFSISGFVPEVVKIPDKYISDTFRDVVISGNPLDWSEDDWAKYYGLFKSGKLLMINGIGNSNSKGYVLSMFYMSGTSNMSVIDSTGGIYKLGTNQGSEENKFYWAPIIYLGDFYFSYIQTGSDASSVKREKYERLEVSNGLTFTTKKANQEAVSQKVVLEGDKKIILSSSTSGSTKKFRITVDDSGTISATEVI